MNQKTDVSALPDGIYPGINESDYHAARELVSSSLLKQVRRTPAHARHYMLQGGSQPTPAMQIGTATHIATLEPESLDARVAAMPDGLDRRTKAGKEEYAELAASGRIILAADDYDMVLRIRDSVHAHPAAATLLQGTRAEVTAIWTDALTGTRCKARADALCNSGKVIIDLKTTTDASPDGFARAVVNFGYALQAAHYVEGFRASEMAFIAVEKVAPYAVGVYCLDDAAIAYGRSMRERLMVQLDDCIRSGVWPSYGDQPLFLSLPRWALSGEEAAAANTEMGVAA